METEYRVAGLPAEPSGHFGWDRVTLPDGTTAELMVLSPGNHTRVLYDQIALPQPARAGGYYRVWESNGTQIWHVDLPAGVLRSVVVFNGPDFGLPGVVTFRLAEHRQNWTNYLTQVLGVSA